MRPFAWVAMFDVPGRVCALEVDNFGDRDVVDEAGKEVCEFMDCDTGRCENSDRYGEFVSVESEFDAQRHVGNV